MNAGLLRVPILMQRKSEMKHLVFIGGLGRIIGPMAVLTFGQTRARELLT